jgi:hypothetical protein
MVAKAGMRSSKAFMPKAFSKGVRLGAAVLAATVFLRAADTNAASNALAVPMAGIRSV